MSTRKRKQQGLVILILSLFVALIAGSAGFATGYGADAAKRSALSKQVEELKASASGSVSSAETDAVKQENEELKAKVTALETEVASLKKENAALSESNAQEPRVNTTDSVLDPIETPSNDNKADGKDTQHVARVSIVDRITKYVILSIVVILVIMGISMFFFGKRRDDDEDYDDGEYPDEMAAPEETPVSEVKTEADIFGDDGLKAEYERYEESRAGAGTAGTKETTSEVPAIKEPAEEQKEELRKEEHRSASVPDTLEELMAKSPSAHDNDE